MARWRFHRELLAEVEQTARWYDRERRGLGDQFLAVLGEVLAELELGPVIASPLPDEPRARRVFLPMFPFAIVFVQVSRDDYLVVAVAHARRRPGYWLERLDDQHRRVRKPHPRVYQCAVDRLGVPASSLVFVSSNAWDAWAASAFGMRVVWCNRYAQKRENLPGAPDHEVRTLAELPALLDDA